MTKRKAAIAIEASAQPSILSFFGKNAPTAEANAGAAKTQELKDKQGLQRNPPSAPRRRDQLREKHAPTSKLGRQPSSNSDLGSRATADSENVVVDISVAQDTSPNELAIAKSVEPKPPTKHQEKQGRRASRGQRGVQELQGATEDRQSSSGSNGDDLSETLAAEGSTCVDGYINGCLPCAHPIPSKRRRGELLQGHQVLDLGGMPRPEADEARASKISDERRRGSHSGSNQAGMPIAGSTAHKEDKPQGVKARLRDSNITIQGTSILEEGRDEKNTRGNLSDDEGVNGATASSKRDQVVEEKSCTRVDEPEDSEKEGNDNEDEAKKADIQGMGGISEYELQRLERIRKNQAFMATLGLGAVKPPPSATDNSSGHARRGAKAKKRSRPVSRGRESSSALASTPVRRSARVRGAEAVNYNEGKKHQARALATEPEPEPEPELEEVEFDDSTVLKYLCRSGTDGEVENISKDIGHRISESTSAVDRKLVGVQLIDPDRPLLASGLSTIYTMHFCRGGESAPPLLAAGGKGGAVALFSAQVTTAKARGGQAEGYDENDDDSDDQRTLINFKAHKGWVSAVRFVDRKTGMSRCYHLLSSANDSVVKLWDTSKQHRRLPRLLCANADLHPTLKGIFSMDVHGARVVTGSKDTTVSLAFVTPTGITRDRVLGVAGGSEAFHQKVVKGVELRDEHTVASCGDDAAVCVSDVRDASASSFGVSIRLDGVHSGPCHTVRWHPRDAYLLLSAGLDSAVNLHDLRRPGTPVHIFRGHCPYTLPRPKAIHRPEFVCCGEDRFGVITCGERSDKLSLYDVGTGAAVSRGFLGAEASALAVGGEWTPSRGTGIIAAAKPGGEIALLEPVWQGA